DLYGHRKMLRIAVVCVGLGSLLLAIAPNFAVLLIGRVLMGPLAVWLPLEIAILASRLREDQTRPAIGKLAGVFTVGIAGGSFLSGFAMEYLGSLRLALGVMFLLTIVCAVIVFVMVPETTSHATGRVDVPGFIGLAIGVVLLQFSLSQVPHAEWTAPIVWMPIIAAAVVFAVWMRWERRAEDPAIDMRIFAHRGMLPVQIAGLLVGVSMFAFVGSTPFIGADPAEVGYGLGQKALAIGMMLVPPTLASAVGAFLVGRFANVIGLPRAIALGAGIMAAGYGAIIVFHESIPQFLTGTIIVCFGLGFTLGGVPALITERAPRQFTGIATAGYQTLKPIGTSVAGGIAAAVIGHFVIAGTATPTMGAYQLVWAISAVASLVIIPLILVRTGQITIEEIQQ
ncbi:MAG: MFS transporter, partial [Rhodococcus sp. (in: high G+C Gram-positive bacteria)]